MTPLPPTDEFRQSPDFLELNDASNELLSKARSAGPSELANAIHRVTEVIRLQNDVELQRKTLSKIDLERSKLEHDIRSGKRQERFDWILNP